ncbi:nitronate monooxygenase [Paraburkholderia humisilvae]|uniref:nitronate monooxygenase n=1 Tax=Paraburkholderia humisilvae TaxID=627669 RepID=UPI001FE396D4|nr:nitronate monooxygenase [Paraburkholderia humisilvae]
MAQGSESGGHLNRGTIGLLSLLPAILGIAEGRPVLAAGGITDRYDVRTVSAPRLSRAKSPMRIRSTSRGSSTRQSTIPTIEQATR